MKTSIGTLVIFNVHRDFRPRLQVFARCQLVAFHIGRNDIVGLAHWNSLGKLASMVGKKLPSRFFLVRPPYFDLDPIERMALRIPNCSDNKSVRFCLWFLAMACPRSRRGMQKHERQQYGAAYNEIPERTDMRRFLRNLRPPTLFRRHLRRLPRPRLRRRSSVPPDSP